MMTPDRESCYGGMSVPGFPKTIYVELESMAYLWVLSAPCFGFVPIKSATAIRRRSAQFAVRMPSADPFVHVLITRDLVVEKA
jgi:hypothetical protein